MSNPGPVLSVRGLSKAYGAVQALRDVSIECREGEIHALVGENGSGKSTLLGIASGFLAPDAGTVEIGGSRLAHHAPAAARRLGLGIAYQDYSHVLELSVAENVFLAVPADARPAYGRMREAIELGAHTDSTTVEWLLEAAAFEREARLEPASAERHLGIALRLAPHDPMVAARYREVAAELAETLRRERAGRRG